MARSCCLAPPLDPDVDPDDYEDDEEDEDEEEDDEEEDDDGGGEKWYVAVATKHKGVLDFRPGSP